MRRSILRVLGVGLGLCIWGGALPADEVLTNNDVIELVKSGLGEAIIKEKITTSENIFDVSAKALIALKKNEVPETLIQLMHQEALKNQKKLRSRIASEIQNLASDSEISRRGASVFLKKIGSAALPQLRDGLGANTPEVRLAIIEHLGRLADQDSAPMLRETLEDSDRRLRLAAATALAKMADDTALELARQSVKQDGEPADGYLHLLGKRKDTASAAAVELRMLKAFAAETRAEAAWALGEIAMPAASATLEEALLHDNDVNVKKRAAEALGKIANPDSFTKLTDACRNLPAVREEVLTAIGRYPARMAVPFLISALPQPMKNEEKQAVLKALRQHTGRDFGNDLAAWNHWLEDNAAQFKAPDTPAQTDAPAPADNPAPADAPAAQ